MSQEVEILRVENLALLGRFQRRKLGLDEGTGRPVVEDPALLGRLEQKPEKKPREKTVLRSNQDSHRLFPRVGFSLP
jgi:hypothetical protein